MARRVGAGQPEPKAIKNEAMDWDDYLNNDEQLLWQGRPELGLRFHEKTTLEFLLGLFFLGMAWVVYSKSIPEYDAGKMPWFFVIIVAAIFLFLCATALYFMIVQHFIDAKKRKHTRFALTDKRAFIYNGWYKEMMQYWPIDADTMLDYRKGEESSIYFAETETRAYRRSGSHMVTTLHGFEYITDGEKVYKLMRTNQGKTTP